MLKYQEEYPRYFKPEKYIKYYKPEKCCPVILKSRSKTYDEITFEPEPAPKDYITFRRGTLLYGGLAIGGAMISSTVGSYMFLGSITLLGVIVVIESMPKLKRYVKHSSKILDLTVLVATIWATATLGITITAALTVAGLGLSLVYFPALREGKL